MVAIVAAIGCHSVDAAAAEDEITAWAGIDLAIADPGVVTQHGIVLLAWKRTGLPKGASLYLGLNTDTLIADYGGFRLSDRVTIGGRFRGELHFGNLLPDFFVGGEKIDEYGVSASFLELALRTKYSPADKHFLTFELAFQPWFLRKSGGLASNETNPNLVIPDPILLLRPRIDYTYWSPGNDVSNWEEHRPFPRTNGVAFGVAVGLDIRPDDERWGYLEGVDFDPVPVLQRNNPDHVAWYTRGWFRWGGQPSEFLRIQGSGQLGTGAGGDDVTRSQIGGQNPYVVKIPGVAWAGFLSESFAQTDAEVRGVIGGTHELGIGGAVAGVSDPYRLNNAADWAAIPSLYALADIRFSGWQLDTRVAFAPELEWSNIGPHFGVFVSIGRTWQLGADKE